jgi:hypothetical protein
LISCPTRTPTDPSRALPSQTRPDRGRPAHMAGGPPSPCAHKRRWGPAALITRLTVPYTSNHSRSSGEAQPAAGLLTTGATSSPYSAAVPCQCRWRPQDHRDLIRAASTPTVAMATTPPPAPTRGPPTHEDVSRTPSLSISLMPRQDLATPT